MNRKEYIRMCESQVITKVHNVLNYLGLQGIATLKHKDIVMKYMSILTKNQADTGLVNRVVNQVLGG
jgi:hypothetical protein